MRGWWLTIAVLVLAGACGDGTEPTLTEPTTTTAPVTTATRSEPTATTVGVVGQLFESRLSYLVELPAEWITDTSPEVDSWSDSMIGGDGDFFRSRVYDHPNRDPFVDLVPKFLPTLAEAVSETAALFPVEFGSNPAIEMTTIDGRAGYVIRPSADSLSPGTLTYIFEAPVTVTFRFIEFAVGGQHRAETIASLDWLPPPASWIDPEIVYAHNRTGRRVLEDMFDAMAAGEWEIAARYLLAETEWPGPAIAALIGEYDPAGEPLGTSLANYCATALCGASFSIGDSRAISEAQHSFEVTFEGREGPVVEQMNVGWFEGEATINSVPPVGTAGSVAAPIDVRLFGEHYPRELAIMRYKATELVHGTDHAWYPYLWELVSAPVGVAGASVISKSASYGDGAVSTDGQRVVLAENSAFIVGAATPGGVPLVFVGDDRGVILAVDPEGIEVSELFDFTAREEAVYAIDASVDRIVVSLAIGESTALEISEFDPRSRAVGSLIARIEPEGYLGAANLAPDGATIAVTLDPTFYDQAQTVAILDSSDGTVLDTWSLEGEDVIDSLDYDGRYVLAQLQSDTIIVIDTSNRRIHRTMTGAVVRFG